MFPVENPCKIVEGVHKDNIDGWSIWDFWM